MNKISDSRRAHTSDGGMGSGWDSSPVAVELLGVSRSSGRLASAPQRSLLVSRSGFEVTPLSIQTAYGRQVLQGSPL